MTSTIYISAYETRTPRTKHLCRVTGIDPMRAMGQAVKVGDDVLVPVSVDSAAWLKAAAGYDRTIARDAATMASEAKRHAAGCEIYVNDAQGCQMLAWRG